MGSRKMGSQRFKAFPFFNNRDDILLQDLWRNVGVDIHGWGVFDAPFLCFDIRDI